MNRRQFLSLGAAAAITPLIKFAPAPAPAYAEGSTLAKPPPALLPLANDQQVLIGYANAVEGYEHVYPTLAKAVKNMAPAHNTKIEWLVPYPHSKTRFLVKHNYMQIVRTPFGVTGTEMAVIAYDSNLGRSKKMKDQFESKMRGLRKDALHSHLADVEQVLKHGKRGRREWVSTCGGVECFGAGELRLRPLRDLYLLKSRQRMDEDRYTEEYLGEFSLQVG